MLEIAGSIWFQTADREVGGERRVALLRAIGESGSITAAAKQVGLSYKGAWDAIDTMNNLAGVPLVVRASGGRGGGGTQLTKRAVELIKTYEAVHALQQDYLLRINQIVLQRTGTLDLMKQLMIKTSARNTFGGTVRQLTPGTVNAEVVIALKGDVQIVASITRESVQSLGLTTGCRAFALVKASSILIGTLEANPTGNVMVRRSDSVKKQAIDDADVPLSRPPSLRLSARNQLEGRIERITQDSVSAEIVLRLPNGDAIAAVVTLDSLSELGLREGDAAVAMFKASSVIVGVTD